MNELNCQQLEVSLEFGLGYQFLTSFINLHPFNRGPTLQEGSSHPMILTDPTCHLTRMVSVGLVRKPGVRGSMESMDRFRAVQNEDKHLGSVVFDRVFR